MLENAFRVAILWRLNFYTYPIAARCFCNYFADESLANISIFSLKRIHSSFFIPQPEINSFIK